MLSSLIAQGEIAPPADKKKALTKMGDTLRPDITRVGALHTVHTLFEKWLPDGGEDYLMKVRAMNHSDKGQRYVDLDDLIDILIEPWTNVRSNWEEHARYLFHDHSSVHRILQEATFANDEGVQCGDTILVEVHKASASDCIRRPLRLFQKTESSEGDFDRGGGSGVVGNPNKESVCEVIDFKRFVDALYCIDPTLPMAEVSSSNSHLVADLNLSLQIESMFEEALDHAHERVLRALELMWMRCVDNSSHGGHKAHAAVVDDVDPSTASAVAAAHQQFQDQQHHRQTSGGPKAVAGDGSDSKRSVGVQIDNKDEEKSNGVARAAPRGSAILSNNTRMATNFVDDECRTPLL